MPLRVSTTRSGYKNATKTHFPLISTFFSVLNQLLVQLCSVLGVWVVLPQGGWTTGTVKSSWDEANGVELATWIMAMELECKAALITFRTACPFDYDGGAMTGGENQRTTQWGRDVAERDFFLFMAASSGDFRRTTMTREEWHHVRDHPGEFMLWVELVWFRKGHKVKGSILDLQRVWIKSQRKLINFTKMSPIDIILRHSYSKYPDNMNSFINFPADKKHFRLLPYKERLPPLQ